MSKQLHQANKTLGSGGQGGRKGLSTIFSGPDVKGKTAAAEIIASELKVDVYKINLSEVVSKYIGETEKNLNNIFQNAEERDAILFFDEAGALFGKRTVIRDEQDPYGEIRILLHRIEQHKGIVIVGAKTSRNINDAFLRRASSIIEFPNPSKTKPQRDKTRPHEKQP